MKLLVDMNLSPRWIEFLQGEGFDAVHWSSVGDSGAPDSEVMRFAAEHDYVVLTYDLDFSAILAATHRRKPSVVQLRDDRLDTDVIGMRVSSALVRLQNELSEGAIVSLDQNRTRVRLLPISRREQYP